MYQNAAGVQPTLLADSIITLDDAPDLYRTKPHLLASTFGLLNGLWSSIPAHNAFIAVLKEKPKFWPHLFQLLSSKPPKPSKEIDQVFLQFLPLINQSDAIANQAYQILVQARAF